MRRGGEKKAPRTNLIRFTPTKRKQTKYFVTQSVKRAENFSWSANKPQRKYFQPRNNSFKFWGLECISTVSNVANRERRLLLDKKTAESLLSFTPNQIKADATIFVPDIRTLTTKRTFALRLGVTYISIKQMISLIKGETGNLVFIKQSAPAISDSSLIKIKKKPRKAINVNANFKINFECVDTVSCVSLKLPIQVVIDINGQTINRVTNKQNVTTVNRELIKFNVHDVNTREKIFCVMRNENSRPFSRKLFFIHSS